MIAIRIFSDDPETLIKLCTPFIQEAKEDKDYLHFWNTPKWFLSELYGYLKHNGDLPELSRERKLELWDEAKKDKLLYLSLYLVEVI